MELTMNNYKKLSRCLCCNSNHLRIIFDLGKQSPANNYSIRKKFPLRLNVCFNCSHAQLSHSVNPDILFRKYPYMSGTSQTMLSYYESFANKFTGKKTVYDIACNDGAQLDAFKANGFETYGIDPAENLIAKTKENGHHVECGYFPNDKATKYDIVIAQNVLAHNDNPLKFLLGCEKIMHSESILCIQTSQANMIKKHQFDAIYHEHISFFNKRSIGVLFSKSGLEITSYEFLPDIHGGSDLFFLKKYPAISLIDYSHFSNESYKFSEKFRLNVENIQKKNKVICYGAAAKMINLIRFSGIKPDYIIDDTPTKHHAIIEGLKVENIGHLAGIEKGSYIIPVWNFYAEIKEKVESIYPNKFKYIEYM